MLITFSIRELTAVNGTQRDFFLHFIFRGAIITPLSITALLILNEAEVIANRDHSLDGGITRAAHEEFLSCGYQKASLHKIAEKAGVTTGAIYTRYKNKDALFGSLLQDFLIRLFGMPFCRKVHPARGLTHFYRNTLVDFATN